MKLPNSTSLLFAAVCVHALTGVPTVVPPAVTALPAIVGFPNVIGFPTVSNALLLK
jgi:hypothetical protein